VQQLRGGLVFKARTLCVSLNSGLASNKEEEEDADADREAQIRIRNDVKKR
jgi:hypothetical protein